ncbi:TMV resistance protein N-like isoform X4 [Gossypium australe]|uniref:TMV resistance protein N-like isoform X4 n=1 Tax=Gossypium australe TaxID=47621 RepID=A0A5B6VT62_9ROSI|nr:TMV resistance protein N-like isoform X4 [Gossypium australe]
MESLEKLILSGCSKLQSFPEIVGKMEYGSGIKELPFSIGNLSSLEPCGSPREHMWVVGNSRKKFDIIIPGSEIPEWFSQQRGDSSIKIVLPLEVRNDSQWMGVAWCCIFVSNDASRDEYLICRAVIHERYSRQANCTQSNFQGRDSREVN